MQTKIYQDIVEHKNLDFRSKITYFSIYKRTNFTFLNCELLITEYTIVLLNIIGTQYLLSS